ncbi:hypothetical protein [Deinococcus aluminii]|uniref:hypothetical protein n=1 Tax=Deinococcus aluminii TaxID=1656885 RepID=UPI0031EC11A8
MRLTVTLVVTPMVFSACELGSEPELGQIYGAYMHIGDSTSQAKIVIDKSGVYYFSVDGINWRGVWEYKNSELDIKFCDSGVEYNLCPLEKRSFETIDPFVRGDKVFLRFNSDEKDVYQKVMH